MGGYSVKTLKKSTLALIGVYLFTVIMNLISWISTEFTDWYADYIYPVFSNTFSRLTSPIPFSLGEALIGAGIVLVAAGLPVFIIVIIVKKEKRKKIAVGTGKFVLWVVGVIICLINLNYFMLNHCTDFSERYYKNSDYSSEAFMNAYVRVTDELIELAPQMNRDEDGYFVMTDDIGSVSGSTMQKLGTAYPQFKGYYPKPKKMLFPKIRSQMGLSGFFAPYTMEANYNAIMHDSNIPFTACHELAHLKGVAKENEANFIAFLACIGSDSAEYRYSGYLMAFSYMFGDAPDTEAADMILSSIPNEAWQDMIFLKPEVREKVEESAIIPTEVISEVSDAVVDAQIKLNGVEDGIKSYKRVNELIMDYYSSEG